MRRGRWPTHAAEVVAQSVYETSLLSHQSDRAGASLTYINDPLLPDVYQTTDIQTDLLQTKSIHPSMSPSLKNLSLNRTLSLSLNLNLS